MGLILKMNGIRRLMVLLGVMIVMSPGLARASTNFDLIELWIGSGSNEAGMLINWHDGNQPEALFWGFRWDGVATGEDMLLGVAAADPRLYVRIGTPNAFGTPLYGIGYDLDGDGFGLSDGTVFTGGIAVTGSSDTATASDADDHYHEGWFSAGFWGYAGSTDGGLTWVDHATGFSGRQLVDGEWDAFSFAVDFAPTPAVAVTEATAAVPVPLGVVAGGALLGLAGIRQRLARK